MPRRFLLATIATHWPSPSALFAITAQPSPTTASPPLDAEEQLFVGLINQYRQQNGLGTLAIDTSLQNAAEWMSTDMGVNNYFSHTDSLGRDPFVRMNAFGYNYNTWKGENIAAGTSSAQTVFDLWKGSSGHNANMLNPNYKVMGIARDDTPGSGYGWYWTNDFGGYVVPGTPTPPPATPSPTPSPAPNSDTDGDGFTIRRRDAPRHEPERPLRQPESRHAGLTEPRLAGGPRRQRAPTKWTSWTWRPSLSPCAGSTSRPAIPGTTGAGTSCRAKAAFAKDINITDLNALITAAPPMFGFQRAFNGPSCTP